MPEPVFRDCRDSKSKGSKSTGSSFWGEASYELLIYCE